MDTKENQENNTGFQLASWQMVQLLKKPSQILKCKRKKYLITILFLIFKGDGIYGITKLY